MGEVSVWVCAGEEDVYLRRLVSVFAQQEDITDEDKIKLIKGIMVLA